MDMKNKEIILSSFLLASSAVIANTGMDGELSDQKQGIAERMEFDRASEKGLHNWKENTFGMMIHWGLYSHEDFAGYFNGQYTDQLSEWLQYFQRIPMKDYSSKLSTFNPIEFDADSVARLAKDAGMKYMVITAKHHDGFSMYNSNVSDYNIYDATPFKRDPLKELADANKKYGIDYGLYYSHVMDWADPNAKTVRGNDWDYDPAKQDFDKYWNEKAMPQVKELLTNYGDLSQVWFDMGERHMLSKNEFVSKVNDMAAMIREHQPDAVINSRIASVPTEPFTNWDIKTGNDNFSEPLYIKPYYWELIATTNDNWGYSKRDFNVKSRQDIVRLLPSVVSRGGNLLLNVGIDYRGRVPSDVTKLLKDVGAWMDINEESVIGAEATPFKRGFKWGVVTHQPETRRIYLHVQQWPEFGLINFTNIRNEIKNVSFLDGSISSESIPWIQHKRQVTGPGIKGKRQVPDTNYTTIKIEKYRDRVTSDPFVIVIDYEDKLVMDDVVHQDRMGETRLDVLNLSKYDHEKKEYTWKFNINRPGKYAIDLMSSEAMHHKFPDWPYSEFKGVLKINGKKQNFQMNMDKLIGNNGQVPWMTVVSRLTDGFEFPEVGEYELTIEGMTLAVENAEKYGRETIPFEYLLVNPRL